MEQLAAAIDSPGLSAKTLRRIVNDNDPRLARPHELREIARACEVPYEFFTEPIANIAEAPSDDDAVLDQLSEFREWAEGAVARMLNYRTETFGRVLERLEQIDRRLAQLDEIPDRVTGLEQTLEPIVDLAVMRAAADFAAAAEPQEPGAGPAAEQDRGRRRQGPGSADQ